MFSSLLNQLFRRRIVALAFGSALLFSACDPDSKQDPVPDGRNTNVYIVNEGNFNTPNGSVSLYDKISGEIKALDVFKAANGRELLADVATSMTIVGERGYIVANNNSKIEVVSLPDFKSVGTIAEPLQQPRYLLAASADKAYVTEWVASPFPAAVLGRVAVVDLKTNKVTKTIPVGKLPEEMLLVNGRLFVANSEGNTLTVINTATDEVETTISVGVNPASLVLGADGHVWVLANGQTDYTDPALSVKGSVSDFAPTAPYTVRKRELGFTPGYGSRIRRNANGTALYLKTGNGVFRLAPTDAALPTTPFINRDFYSLEVDPDSDVLYTGVALSFNGPGRMVTYQKGGAPLDSAEVGILPSGFAFY
ncbi:hypothetical protein HER32_08035 [Hymenobacter sp. BT18]|uniref:YncE family protein n=1 Tax=Hymenobacter sp. BT18 TaxID=2835648 RepID=UPI00143EA52B|nr:DUF5074 domain-containing protein [Hymenobacter sp. BT18]QIX61131.1 hypothetical protein HER32_08035 [Hymenobacter sp. BT18]